MDYAQLTLPHNSIRIFTFELNYKYAPFTLYNWDRPQEPATARKAVNINKAKALATCMYNTWTIAKGFLQRAQAKKQHNVDQH